MVEKVGCCCLLLSVLQKQADNTVKHLNNISPSKDNTLADLITEALVRCEDLTESDVEIEISAITNTCMTIQWPSHSIDETCPYSELLCFKQLKSIESCLS